MSVFVFKILFGFGFSLAALDQNKMFDQFPIPCVSVSLSAILMSVGIVPTTLSL